MKFHEAVFHRMFRFRVGLQDFRGPGILFVNSVNLIARRA